eukprot:TRINITY_DN2541_c0_g2_i2.p1 TRINITY_DN2541_c0_g2~~TRINITY_DN2541_c0_g2_i2.p1  ORF type:complete len:347 (-),score=47.77 TRINITY_DN2541_c0_g2_i2:12-1052(-)
MAASSSPTRLPASMPPLPTPPSAPVSPSSEKGGEGRQDSGSRSGRASSRSGSTSGSSSSRRAAHGQGAPGGPPKTSPITIPSPRSARSSLSKSRSPRRHSPRSSPKKASSLKHNHREKRTRKSPRAMGSPLNITKGSDSISQRSSSPAAIAPSSPSRGRKSRKSTPALASGSIFNSQSPPSPSHIRRGSRSSSHGGSRSKSSSVSSGNRSPESKARAEFAKKSGRRHSVQLSASVISASSSEKQPLRAVYVPGSPSSRKNGKVFAHQPHLGSVPPKNTLLENVQTVSRSRSGSAPIRPNFEPNTSPPIAPMNYSKRQSTKYDYNDWSAELAEVKSLLAPMPVVTTV